RAFDLCPQTKKHLLRRVDKIDVSFQVIVISMFLPSSIRPLPQHVSSLLCEHNLLSPLPVCEHNSLDVFVLSFFAFLRAGLNFSPSRLLLKPVLYTNVIIAGSLFPSSSTPPTISLSTTLSNTYRSNVSITSFCSNTFLKANRRFLTSFSSSKFDKDFSRVCTFSLISCMSE